MSALGNSPNPPLAGAQTDPRDPSAATKFALFVEEDPSLFGKVAIGLVVLMTFLRFQPFPSFVLLLMFCFMRMGAPTSGSYEILTQVCVHFSASASRLGPSACHCRTTLTPPHTDPTHGPTLPQSVSCAHF